MILADPIDHWHLYSLTPQLSELPSSVPLRLCAPLSGLNSEIKTNVLLVTSQPASAYLFSFHFKYKFFS